MPSMTITSTNVGHPHADPETGLVDEEHAWGGEDDDPDDGFGDGRTIVAAEALAYDHSDMIAVQCRVRPTEAQAPRSANDRPMNHYVMTGDSGSFDAVDDAVRFFTDRGIVEGYARGLVEGAVSAKANRVARAAKRVQVQEAVDRVLKQTGVKPGQMAALLGHLSEERLSPELATARVQLVELAEGLSAADLAEVRRSIGR